MPVTCRNTFVGKATLNATELDQNFDDVETYSANIPGSDIQNGTISNSKLTNSLYEFALTMQFIGSQAAADGGITPQFIAMIPGTTTDGAAYTVISAAYSLRSGTSTGPTFLVQCGYFNSGTWTNALAGNIINSNTPTPVQYGATGHYYVSGASTLVQTGITMHSSTQYGFGLIVTGIGGLTAIDHFLTVTLKLKRTSGLRS